MKKWYIYIFTLILVGFSSATFAQADQEQALAQQFYQQGEYEKAAEIYERLHQKDPNNTFVYRYLYNSLLALKEYDNLEKIVNKQRRKNPNDLGFLVDLGYLYVQSGEVPKGEVEYKSAINKLTADDGQIRRLAHNFINIREFDYAIQVFENGRKLRKDDKAYALDLANIYQQKGSPENAVKHYLEFIELNAQNVQVVKNMLQRSMNDDAYYDEMRAQLYSLIQKNPQSEVYPDLLVWMFMQKGDFNAAFNQVRALDKRLNENGHRVLELARAASAVGDYDAAIKSYEYIVTEKGKSSSLYIHAFHELLNSRRLKITGNVAQTTEELQQLEQDYLKFLSEFGNSQRTVEAKMDLAGLYAFYLHQTDSAIAMLEEVVNTPSVSRAQMAKAKLDLGDFYLLKGDVWESTLLYSQVDKTMKDEPQGEMARFKNAKLSYYKGDFEWAQAQLSVLKSATSDIIANDALHLSVFITDNMGLDTSMLPMLMFSQADLLAFQRKHDQALEKFDNIIKFYPGHALTDDVNLAKAKILIKQKKYDLAVTELEKIVTAHAEDILADDALFILAELHEKQLNNKEKAKEFYEKIIVDYNDSILVVEARKRFRNLRGDQVQ